MDDLRNNSGAAASRDDANFLVRRLLTSESAGITVQHQWANEQGRWRELVFAVLASVTSLSQHELRRVVHKLEVLGLLDIAALSRAGSLPPGEGPTARRILGTLTDAGVERREAELGVTAVGSIAQVVQ